MQKSHSLSKCINALFFLAFAITPIEATPIKAAEKRLLTIDDFTAFARLTEPVYSHDGKSIVYTVSRDDFSSNSSHSQIFLAPAHGGEAAPMTSEFYSSWNPVFSPDDKTLYFLSQRDRNLSENEDESEEEKAQLWALNLQVGGEARKLTNIERGIDKIRFSPNQSTLLLLLDDENTSAPLVEGSEPAVVDKLQIKADYVGYLNHQRTHLYSYDIGSKKLSQLTFGDFDDSEPSWSPDGKHIAFVSNRSDEPDRNTNTDIWIVPSKAKASPAKLRRVTRNLGADYSPHWHPDGKSIAYLAHKAGIEPNYAMPLLYRSELKSGHVTNLSESLDRVVSDPKFTADGKSLYFLIEDNAEQHLGRLDWDTGVINRPIEEMAVVNDYSVTSNVDSKNDSIAAVISYSDAPAELYLAQSNTLRPLTEENRHFIESISLGRTKSFTSKAPDGWNIESLVTFPPNYRKGRSYPTVLRIHGGPVMQYDRSFSYNAQLLAAQGYVVIRSNPRGSSGYGQDFTLGLWQGWGEKDYQDVLSAVDYAIAQGWSDADRLGMGGYSYGGILTNYLLGQTERFKAAVSGAGSGLYIASYGHDEYQQWYESELGLPWENRSLWERLSPFNYIHKATTPTLFMGGSADWNVPIQGSEQLYQVMRRRGIDTQLVVYPGEHHGGWSFANDMDYWHRTLAWYARYLKPSLK